jgi:hypothetical protein
VKIRLAALALVLTLSALLAGVLTSRGENEGPVTAFVNVNLVPMSEEKVVENQTVLVQGRQIVAIGPADQVSVPKNATIIYQQAAIRQRSDLHYCSYQRAYRRKTLSTRGLFGTPRTQVYAPAVPG